jgi:hypothetical protein
MPPWLRGESRQPLESSFRLQRTVFTVVMEKEVSFQFGAGVRIGFELEHVSIASRRDNSNPFIASFAFH